MIKHSIFLLLFFMVVFIGTFVFFSCPAEPKEQKKTENPLPSNPPDPLDPLDPSDPLDPPDPLDPSDPLDPPDPLDPADPLDPPGSEELPLIEFDETSMLLYWEPVQGATRYAVSRAKSRWNSGAWIDLNSVEAQDDETYIAFKDVSPNLPKYENYYLIKAFCPDPANPGSETLLSSFYLSLELSMFGPAVLIFSENDDPAEIQAEINRIHDTEMLGDIPQEDGRRIAEFSSKRYAFFFKPGTYPYTEYRIGFYTSIAGLGSLPTKSILSGGKLTTPTHTNDPPNRATRTFWRSIENLRLSGSSSNLFEWAVSQAAPVRRMQVDIPTAFHLKNGYISGGFSADNYFAAKVEGSSQQQYYIRHCHFGASAISGVNWNKLVQASTGSVDNGSVNIEGFSVNNQYTRINEAPVIREKPFLFYDDTDDEYKVFVPGLRFNETGISWGDGKANGGMGNGQIIDFSEHFYVAQTGRDTADTINAQLNAGKHIYFSPGKYEISAPITVKNPDTVILGNGYPTLYPSAANGDGLLFVDDVPGVTVAGLMFEAAPQANSVYLLTVGETGANANHSANPILLADLCMIVGGYYNEPVHADISALINSNNVIGDHFWVWRANHMTNGYTFGMADIDWDANTTINGVVVMGDDVIMYGLFVEHYHQYNTLWLGERGKMYFHQNEPPYEPHYQRQYMSHNGTVNGWAQYKVDNRVNEHLAVGLGLYSVFANHQYGVRERILIDNAIEVPNKPGVKVVNACITRLGTVDFGGIASIVNGAGSGQVDSGTGPQRLLLYNNGTARITSSSTVNNIAQPSDETHWVESLRINKNGKVTANPEGGIPYYMFQ